MQAIDRFSCYDEFICRRADVLDEWSPAIILMKLIKPLMTYLTAEMPKKSLRLNSDGHPRLEPSKFPIHSMKLIISALLL